MTRNDWMPSYLLDYRQKNEITQAKLAEILGVKQSQLCKWENGKHKPTELRIRQIVEVLKDVEIPG